MNLTTKQIARLLVVLREPKPTEQVDDIFQLLTTEFVKRTSGKTIDFLQVVYSDWCDKHGIKHKQLKQPMSMAFSTTNTTNWRGNEN